EGALLAEARRQALAELIPTDPQRALELAVPQSVRAELPGAVTALLEEEVTARGDYQVLGVRPLPGAEAPPPPVVRVASIGGVNYETYTFGQGLTYLTHTDVPLHGIAVDVDAASSPARQTLVPRDRLLALDPNPARELAGPE